MAQTTYDLTALDAMLANEDHRTSLRQALDLFDGPISTRALGRLLGRSVKGVPNPIKGERIQHALDITPCSPQECAWDEGVFGTVDTMAKLAAETLENYDHGSFLVGTRTPPHVHALEQRIQQTLEASPAGQEIAEHFEPLKAEMNREAGAAIVERTGKTVAFDRPDVNILIDPWFQTVEATPSHLYLYARYRKFDRTIPQTAWPCNRCRGLGCPQCEDTGQQYRTSVEALVAAKIIQAFDAKGASFHGMGREDIDALMLGTGRPFIIELKEPRWRTPRQPIDDGDDPSHGQGGNPSPARIEQDQWSRRAPHMRGRKTPGDVHAPELIVRARGTTKADAPVTEPATITYDELVSMVNEHARGRIEIDGLKPVEKSAVAHIKGSAMDKAYRAHVVADAAVPQETLDQTIATIVAEPIAQRTPRRVAHRRADKVRKRSVRSIDIVSLCEHLRDDRDDPKAAQSQPAQEDPPTDQGFMFTLDIVAESGTYIKELVSGDEGRTKPSLAALVDTPMRVAYLDVVGVPDAQRPSMAE